MLQKQNAYDVAFHVGKQTNFVKEFFNDKSTEGVSTIREHTGIIELNKRMDRNARIMKMAKWWIKALELICNRSLY